MPVPVASTVGPHLPAPSVTIPSVNARQLNEQSESIGKRMKATASTSSVSVAADVKQSEANENAKASRKSCPECGSKKHTRKSKCKFVEFVRKQKDLPVDDPLHAKRHTDEQPYDCYRRVYIERKAAGAS